MIPGLAHGQVWWADVPGEKVRPVVVLTRATVAPLLLRVMVAPVTSTVRGLRSEIAVGAAEGVAANSVANLDNVQLLPVDRLIHRAGAISRERWTEVCDALGHAVACDGRR
jgi:mRNA interferase MazF